ncbi:MAG: ABC transporter ATP-binding protein [Bacteroidetes bacterium]|nr:ABC transporter ATP-binding protein [Bacteroidota bacterium]MBX7130403.1 ABC transporter ATP-binding protein/permease [Flavobacteriales bacterium]MCC6656098.1 ABC transporter ATP-binding protein [Flavobacteriales bacterium]HMU12816.1 ABC transporter ATP-binding protein [Flavobacteriales bacterium]HNE80169.1 ABC transporter ATP-binding protein [Flavobacteriales bacterium]
MSTGSSTSGKAFDARLFARLMTFVRPYRKLFWSCFALTILLSGITVVRPVLMGHMIDGPAAHGDRPGLVVLLSIVVGLLVLETVLGFVQAFWTARLGLNVTFDLRQKLYEKILNFKLRWYDRTPVGTLVTRVVSDIETVEDIFSQGLLMIMGDILKLVVVVVVMFAVNWELALLSMTPIPVLLWATNIFKNSIAKSFQDVRTQVARLNAFTQEHIQGMAITQLFAREEQEQDRFTAINREHRAAHIRSVLAYSIYFPVVEVLGAISLAFLIWWGMGDVLEGTATFGELVAYIQFINMLFRPIRQLADRFNTLQMGMVGSERIFKVLDTEESIADTGTRSTSALRGDIAFENVTFGYDPAVPVLHGISFSAKAGEMIALVGATGSGKSSIINVLGRAYEYQDGRVLLDGHDIREYKLDELRTSVATVLQDVFLFSDTVLNNITLNDPSITREHVIEAAKAVGAHAFIEALPQGYDTDVRERGSVLSTGQRQLLAFIRAYVNRPKVLVLDEATSSVDSLSEQLITEATARITKGRTSIVIAHRLSTVQDADRILVVDKGRIIEQGSHQELLAHGGEYKKLYDLQFH